MISYRGKTTLYFTYFIVPCPVCRKELSSEDINQHLDLCLQAEKPSTRFFMKFFTQTYIPSLTILVKICAGGRLIDTFLVCLNFNCDD